jgi:hypothetical protein
MENKKADSVKRRKTGHNKTFKKRKFRGGNNPKSPTANSSQNVDDALLSTFSKKIKHGDESQQKSPNDKCTNASLTTTPKRPPSRSYKNVNNDGVNNDDVNNDGVNNGGVNNDVDDSFPSCFLFMDTSVLYSLLSLLSCCPNCESRDINFKIDLERKKGLSVLLEIICS